MKYKTTNYSDRLIYDKGTHRFSLDAEWVEANVKDINRYSTDVQLQEELDAQSELLYDWIYSSIPLSNINYVEYILAKNEVCIKPIYEALYLILLSDLQGNTTQARFYLGINFKSNNALDKETIRASLLTENVKMKIENIPGNLLTTRSFGVILPKDRYERWDY
jgi:hypothetical protein